MKNCYKTLLNFFFVFIISVSVFTVHAQIKKVEIGVNGLTCSQCTRNVEMSIRKLPFVKDVVMSLEQTEGTVTFYANKKIEIEKIAQAVIKAGFSLRFLKADINIDELKISDENFFDMQNDRYQFIRTDKTMMNGTKTIQFLGSKYLSKPELKRWNSLLKSPSMQTYYFVTVI